jgi:hypothetical protein
MPLRDGSGPMGRGSRTGRGRGNCVSNDDRYRSMGGRGWFCRRSNDPKDLEMHKEYLKNQLSWVENLLSRTKSEDK